MNRNHQHIGLLNNRGYTFDYFTLKNLCAPYADKNVIPANKLKSILNLTATIQIKSIVKLKSTIATP